MRFATEFASDRRTSLELDMGELDIEDLIDDEDLVVTLSSSGYIKSVSAEEFRAQARGGRGVTGAKLKDDDDDLVAHLLHTTAHAYLLFFTTKGKVYRIKAHSIPVSSRTSRGMALVNLLQLESEEKVQAIIDTRDYETNQYLFFATRQGRVKKTLMSAYDSSLKAGLRAINLNDGDELVSVVATNGVNDIFMVSRFGQALRFSQDHVRAMGRTAAGVRGMKFRAGDELVSMDLFRPETELLVVTSEGYGKRTDPDLFTRKGRAGLGVRCVKVNEKKGQVVGAMFVTPLDEIFLISTDGVVIRTRVSAISQQGRDATGVTVMSLNANSQVAAVARMLAVEEPAAERFHRHRRPTPTPTRHVLSRLIDRFTPPSTLPTQLPPTARDSGGSAMVGRQDDDVGVDREQGQRGAALPLVALVLACLLVMTGIVIGVSVRAVDRAQAQSAADAAALAAVAEGRAGAERLATANGGVLIEFDAGDNEVRVVVEVDGRRAEARAERILAGSRPP